VRVTSPQDERRLFWDEEDRLVKTLDSRSETVYAYDASGERVVKRGPYGEAVYVNGYYAVRNGAIESKQIFAGNTRVATKMANKGKDQGTYYYHGDHLASSNVVTTRTGVVHEYLDYFPYGETWVHEKATTGESMPYKFTSKELDPETGLYYFGARYYEPRVSRWVSADPALEEYLPSPANFNTDNDFYSQSKNEQVGALPGMGGVYNPKNIDLYCYTHNNSIRYNDPDGKMPTILAGALIGGAVGAITGATSAILQGNNSVRQILGGAAGGAISGAATGALIGSGVGVVALVAGSAAGGAMGSVAENVIANGPRNLDVGKVVMDATVDGIIAGASAGVSTAIPKLASGIASKVVFNSKTVNTLKSLNTTMDGQWGKIVKSSFSKIDKIQIASKQIMEKGLGLLTDIMQDKAGPSTIMKPVREKP